jgi:dynein heavy chain
MDKEMRTWDTYVTLEATVKNMLTSLRAVGELQNSAIRERHWQQLMKSTKVMIQNNLMLCCYYTGVTE